MKEWKCRTTKYIGCLEEELNNFEKDGWTICVIFYSKKYEQYEIVAFREVTHEHTE